MRPLTYHSQRKGDSHHTNMDSPHVGPKGHTFGYCIEQKAPKQKNKEIQGLCYRRCHYQLYTAHSPGLGTLLRVARTPNVVQNKGPRALRLFTEYGGSSEQELTLGRGWGDESHSEQVQPCC